jgi:tetratricopeptide (TPR) repeat protein
MGRFSKLETGKRKLDPNQDAQSSGIEAGAGYPEQVAESDEKMDRDAAGWLRLGDGALFQDERKKALRWYSRAMDMDSTLLEAWIALIRTLLLRNDLTEATAWITRGLTLFPNSPQLLALRAVQYARRGMLRQAINNSDAVLEQNGSEPLAHIARGEVLLLAENKNADYCFEQGVKLTPANDWRTPFVVGLILQERRLWAKAIQFYAMATERHESSAALWYHIGLCRAQLGQTLLARKAFQQAREICPPNDPLLIKIDRAKSGSILRRIFRIFTK